MWLDNRKMYQTLGQISEMLNESSMVNEYNFTEEVKIDLLMLVNSQLPVTIITQWHGNVLHVVYGGNFIETFKKFINNEITLDGRFFKDLSVPEQRILFAYEPHMYGIARGEPIEKVQHLVNTMKMLG